ncbi:bile salt-activated lipase-like [Chrysoperla carnea]|uniref:bile salt-activated lipase-like n=1 Tax=Chrysoperla carnea TaxID=189513 RepID=UPI001D068AD2|nr:bile salt-activated lipase-like [Chrysoperla carnea]
MTTYWTNFAKYSNPNPPTPDDYDAYINIEWKPYTLEEPFYMDIDKKLSLKQNLFKDRMKFWDQLYVEAAIAHSSLR